MALIPILAASFLCFIFAESLSAHVSDRKRFTRVLSNLEIPNAALTSVLVITVEVGLISSFFVTISTGAWMAIGYISAASALMTIRLASGASVPDCGCGPKPHVVDKSFFLRNAFLAGVALTVILLPTSEPATIAAMGLATLLGLVRGVATSSETSIKSQEIEGTISRRHALKLAAKGAGGGVASLALFGSASQASRLLRFGSDTSDHVSNEVLIASGSGLDQTRAILRQFPNLNSALDRVPGASKVAWDHTLLFGLEEETSRYRLEGQRVMAPIIRANGKGVATLMRFTGDVIQKKTTRAPFALEERLQLAYEDSDGPVILLLSPSGGIETHRPTRSLPSGPLPGPTPNPSGDIDDCSLDVVWEIDGRHCKCGILGAEPCGNPDFNCLTYKCSYQYGCCKSTPCVANCRICSGICCGEGCTTCTCHWLLA